MVTRIGRNDPCICGSELKFKKCCIQLVEPWTPRQDFVLTFLSYAEMWPHPRPHWDEIHEELFRYRREELLRLFLKLNVLTTLGTWGQAIARQGVLANGLYPESWRKKFLYWMKRGRFEIILPREVTLTAFAKVLTLPQTRFGTEPVDAHREEIGPLLSKIACLVSRIDDSRFQRGTDEEKAALVYGHAYRSGYFRHSDNSGSLIGRWWGMLTKGLPEAQAKHNLPFDVSSILAKSVGLSMQEYLLAILGVWGHYAEHEQDLMAGRRLFWFHPGYLRAAGKDPTRGEAILAALTSDLEVLSQRLVGRQDEPFGYAGAFYNHPIIRLDETSIAAFDMSILEHQLGPGLFWRTFLGLSKKSEREQLKTAFGYAFEWYVSELLRDGYPDSCALDWDGTCPRLQGVRTVDAIVRDGDSLYFIEATTMAPKPSTSLSGDWNAIKQELEEIWFGRGAEGESAKLIQLHGALEAFKDGRLDISTVSKGVPSRIVPVLLLANPLPQPFGLGNPYRQIMRSHGCLDEEFINQVLFLDIGELEGLLALREEGHSLSQLIRAWRNSDLADQSLNNYLYARVGKFDRPRVLKGLLTEAFEQIQALMRPDA